MTLNGVLQILLKGVPGVDELWITESTVEAATYWGFGTWEKVEDRMLVGAGGLYTLGDEAGEATHTHTTSGHTLSVNEIPEHSHEISYAVVNRASGSAGVRNVYGGGVQSDKLPTTGAGGGGSHSHGNTGSSSSMPPYRAVNIWRRTA